MSYPAPILNLNFANAKQLGDKVAFSRASVALRRAFNGNNVPIRAGMAIFDHSAEGASLGLRPESSATNRVVSCRDMTQAAWACSGCTPALNATGIDGVANSASTLAANTSNATALQSITLVSGARCYSVHVKRKIGTGKIYITLDGGATWTDITANLSTSSYYRAYVTATVTNPQFGVKIETSGDAVYLDFHQLEDGTFPSSGILTTTAAVTRAADVASVDLTKLVGTGGEPLWTGTEGTIVVDAIVPPVVNPVNYQRLISLDDGTSENRVTLSRSPSNGKLGIGNVVAGASVFSQYAAAASENSSRIRVVIAVNRTEYAWALNGSLEGSASAANGTMGGSLKIGCGYDGTFQWGGTIRSVQLYNRRIADAYLPALSAL